MKMIIYLKRINIEKRRKKIYFWGIDIYVLGGNRSKMGLVVKRKDLSSEYDELFESLGIEIEQKEIKKAEERNKICIKELKQNK